LFLDTVFAPERDCVVVWGHPATINDLKRDVFNDRIWPDFVRLSHEEAPFLRFETLESERPVTVAGLTVTPVELNHVIPTFGFLVSDAQATVGFVSDTGPTERIWALANADPKFRALFLEVSFPESMAWLAERARHLTPRMFQAELRKLTSQPEVIVVHLKPAHRRQILAELHAMQLPRLQIGVPEQVYEF
jgi:cAMP phosphodiesterase